jgi:sec-independent protein translocase protein TatC
MTDPKDPTPAIELPFVQHLMELRDRLLRVVLVIVVIFLALFAFANDLYSYLAEPLLRHMPEGTSMIATEVASPFLTPFKLTLVLSIFLTIPVILHQAWGFIAPGLYSREKRLVFPLLVSSTFLFFLGMAFAYYIVFPLVFGFLTGVAPEGVSVMTDISRYLDFVLKMFFAFGLAFEVPIATILVVWSGMTTAENLAKKRPYIIVGAFVFGMLLTPPDIISQTLLAVPMWILFEIGLLLSKWYVKEKKVDASEDEINNEDEEFSSVDKVKTDSSGKGEEDYVSTRDRIKAGAVVKKSVIGPAERVEPTFSDSFEPSDEDDIDDNTYGDSNGDVDDSNESGHQEFEPLTEDEMDAELDRIEAEESELEEGSEEQDEPDSSSDSQPEPSKGDKKE